MFLLTEGDGFNENYYLEKIKHLSSSLRHATGKAEYFKQEVNLYKTILFFFNLMLILFIYICYFFLYFIEKIIIKY